MKVRGRVMRSDLEGGVWVLHADGGETYQLSGGGSDLLRDGVEATIEGTVDGAMASIGMMGSVLVVSTYVVHGRGE